MTRRRWIADEFSGDRAALTGAHAAHLSRTLRARVGQQFEVACGDQVRRATVSSVQDERVEFTLGEEVTAREAVPITLLLAVFKFDRMEWAIEKCTELNVTTIVPVIARRTEKHLPWLRTSASSAGGASLVKRPSSRGASRLRRSADPLKLKEALAQLTTIRMMSIPSEDFSPSRGNCGHSGCDLRIVLAETEPEATLSEVLRARDHVTSLALAVGPEGGWTTEELQLSQRRNGSPRRFGDTILRAETAAIAAVADSQGGVLAHPQSA